MKKLFVIFALLFAVEQAYCQYFADTVWTNNVAGQSNGFYMVKFSNTDSLIVGHGYDYDLFFDAKTGKEIKRILGSNEVFFINNDSNFIRLDENRLKFEIFDAKTYKVVDNLEYDGLSVNEYPQVDVSQDEKYLVAPINKGFRIWDLNTKKILRTKELPDEENLTNITIIRPRFICGTNNIIVIVQKTYKEPEYPYHTTTVESYNVYDLNTLDSIDSYGDHGVFRLSNTCKYIAYGEYDMNYGVTVNDFATKQLLWKIPINGYSLSGIEFSPDDKYLVTSNTTPGDQMHIWDLSNGEKVHSYLGTSFGSIDVSHDGKYLVDCVSNSIELLYARFGESSVEEKTDTTIIYPNPTTSIITIKIDGSTATIINYNISNTQGVVVQTGTAIPESNTIKFDVSKLPIGTYFITLSNSINTSTYKFVKE